MSVARDIARALRRVPGARAVLTAGDPRRRAERLAASGLIDPAYYAAQYPDTPSTVGAAAADYTTRGFHAAASVNALVDPDVLDMNLMISGRPIIYDYVNSKAWHVPASRWWDAQALLEQHPEAAEHPGGPAGWLWAQLAVGDVSNLVIDGTPATHEDWAETYRLLSEASAAWTRFRADRFARMPDPELEHPTELPERFPEGAPRPKVSVILPVRNRPDGLRTAVASLREQTWTDWELIVVDDGSWDDTLTILDVVAAEDPRVRVLRRAHAGVSAARNAGIAAASGDYVAFLDSDNTWRPRFLEDMMTAMTASGVAAAHASIASRNDDGTIVYRQGATTHQRLLAGNTIDLNTLVVRTDALRDVGGFDTSLRRAVDFDLILKLAEREDLEHVETLGADYDNDETAGDRISTNEPLGWNVAVRLRHLAPTQPPVEEPVVEEPGTTYLICAGWWGRDFETVLDEATALADEPDSEVLLVLIDPRASEWRHAIVRARGRRLTPFLIGANSLSYLVDAHLPYARYDRLVVSGPQVEPEAESLRGIAAAIVPAESRAVMPLGKTPEGTLHGVGAAVLRTGATPVRVLADHPAEDVTGLDPQHPVPALTGSVFGLPTAMMREVGGLDPLLFNVYEAEGLSADLRARRHDATFAVLSEVAVRYRQLPVWAVHVDLPGSRTALRARAVEGHPAAFEAIHATAGFEVTAMVSETDEVGEGTEESPRIEIPRPYLRSVLRRTSSDAETSPRLRWSILTASPAGPKGETWGDTHFARSLADALRALGQDVVVDAREAADRPTAFLDDVRIVLRGLDDITPDPAQLSYLWVISHPDMVTRGEAARYDRVFAASLSWSEQYSERWQIPIEPLLQCTDPGRFGWSAGQRNGDILFVGNSRHVPRAVVLESVRAGVPVKVYGGDWEQFLPAEAISGLRVDNAQLGAMYGAASIVLNDHWADMQREGFVSNRLFDAVAAGGRVVSDFVPGVDELFGGAVRTYSSVSELGPMLLGDHDALFPADDALRGISERIRTEHSFAARARLLLDRAIADRSH